MSRAPLYPFFASPSGKMILLTKKKMIMEMPPLSIVVPMLYTKSGTNNPATATHTHMSPAFHVVQPGDIQLLDAAPGGDHDIMCLPLFDPADGPVQALAEREIADRLEYVVHRVHGVAPDGVLRHIGDENNDHLRIQLANFRGGNQFCAFPRGHRTPPQAKIEFPGKSQQKYLRVPP